MSTEARALVTSTESLRGIINRARQRLNGFGPDARIPEALQLILDG
jgi:hypothetical protein